MREPDTHIIRKRNKKKYFIHILLFVLTIGTTFFVGLSEGVTGALWYSGAIMIILLTHEMGHFLTAKHYGVSATLPYFIPLPLPPFGTMGAVIKMGGRIPNRRALFDIGAAGPIAGLIMIIPSIVIGLKMSQVVTVGSLGENAITLGDSLLFSLLSRAVLGYIPEGQDVLLHPLAYAGWVGLLVTALNLLPIGQLDGGHVIYSLFRNKSKLFSFFFYSVLLVVCLFFYVGWILVLILLAIFRKHPPTMNDYVPLDRKRKILGIIVLVVFVLSFTPVPFGFGDGLIPLLVESGWF
ncbi:MAG: site-2 protease family protein [bacterium]